MFILVRYMKVIYALLVSSLAGMATLLGGIIIFFHIKTTHIQKFITFCLAFSIAIMIGISLTDLIPTSVFEILYTYNLGAFLITIILSLFLGFILVIIINKLMKDNNDSLYKLGILSMVALIIHNFPEGIATFMGSMQDVHLGLKLSLAIMFHNIPEGISIAVPIYYSTHSKRKALLSTFLSGLFEPLGAILAYLFLSKFITPVFISITLLFVAGIMITLAIEEMLPKALSYKENKYIYLGLLIGIGLIIINLFLF